jgi:murein DD-endopeptidase MepM/ murein hydrolase activator NlpD
VIKRDDTLNKISRLYRKSVADIANANNIQLTTRLKVGDHLVIPSVTVNSEPGNFPAKISNHSATSLQSTTAQAKAKHPVKAAKETTPRVVRTVGPSASFCRGNFSESFCRRHMPLSFSGYRLPTRSNEKHAVKSAFL